MTLTAAGRAFLSRAGKEGRVDVAEADIPRSFLLLEGREKGARVMLSHISSLSLGARAESDGYEE